MVGKDLIMATLFGSGGCGSSGSGGGGSAGVSPKEVNFYDYDGTCVHAYTVAEAQALSELPAGPEHPGLVFQGWNWSLEGVKGLTRAMNIGAMYATDDGTTRLHITLQEGRTSPSLCLRVNGTVTVDWGDGTPPDILTGSSLYTTPFPCTPNHVYATPGDYVIRLRVEGQAQIGYSGTGKNVTGLLQYTGTSDARNYTYKNALKKVELGQGMTLGSYAFTSYNALESITVSKEHNVNATGLFNGCESLVAVVIRAGQTDVSNNTFKECKSIRMVMTPESATRILSGAFDTCTALRAITLRETQGELPDSVFKACESLTAITAPGTLSRIRNYAFYNCKSLAYCDFTACTSVPTLEGTTAFYGIPADCEIRVPAALYDEWIAATNWATYASQIKAY